MQRVEKQIEKINEAIADLHRVGRRRREGLTQVAAEQIKEYNRELRGLRRKANEKPAVDPGAAPAVVGVLSGAPESDQEESHAGVHD